MTPEQARYFQGLDSRYLQLLELLNPIFTQEALAQFKEYIDVGEYGLALDEVQGLFNDEKKTVPRSALKMMKELAETMEYPLQEPFASMVA